MSVRWRKDRGRWMIDVKYRHADGTIQRVREVSRTKRGAERRAGLRKIGWHVLRHTFASHLVMKGVPLKTVQELLGHATVEMTMRYAHLSSTVKHDAVAVLDLPGAAQGHHRDTKKKNEL
jgi:site-specific recombinase XerD